MDRLFQKKPAKRCKRNKKKMKKIILFTTLVLVFVSLSIAQNIRITEGQTFTQQELDNLNINNLDMEFNYIEHRFLHETDGGFTEIKPSATINDRDITQINFVYTFLRIEDNRDGTYIVRQKEFNGRISDDFWSLCVDCDNEAITSILEQKALYEKGQVVRMKEFQTGNVPFSGISISNIEAGL